MIALLSVTMPYTVPAVPIRLAPLMGICVDAVMLVELMRSGEGSERPQQGDSIR